jgi:hypothetical protein
MPVIKRALIVCVQATEPKRTTSKRKANPSLNLLHLHKSTLFHIHSNTLLWTEEIFLLPVNQRKKNR